MRVLQNYKLGRSSNVSQNGNPINTGSLDSEKKTPNVSQYGDNIDLKELETAKKWAGAAEEFAKRAEESAIDSANSADESAASAAASKAEVERAKAEADRAEAEADRAEEISVKVEELAGEALASADRSQESALISAGHALDAEYSASKAKDSEELASFFAIAAAASAYASKESAEDSAESAAAAKESADAAQDIYEAFAKGVVYRGGWEVSVMQAYPPHGDINSVWDVILPEGVVKYEWNGVTWFAGDRLIYSVPDNQYFHINHVSGVESVNGKSGAVVLIPKDIGAVATIGDTMTGTLVMNTTDKSNNKIQFGLSDWHIEGRPKESHKFVISETGVSDRLVFEKGGKATFKGTLYEEDNRVYSDGNKPSADALNLVSRSGDTMVGKLIIDLGDDSNDSNCLEVKSASTSPIALSSSSSEIGLKLSTPSYSYYLGISSDSYLRFGNNPDHNQNSKIFTDVNPPTWEEVGGDLYWSQGSNYNSIKLGVDKFFVELPDNGGILPQTTGTSSVGSELLMFDQSWVNQYKGNSLDVTGSIKSGSTLSVGASDGWKAGVLADTVENEYLFGGSPFGVADLSDYIRIGVNKLQFRTDSETDRDIYWEGNKPSAGDITGLDELLSDYLPKAGGKMTGVLTVRNPIPVGSIQETVVSPLSSDYVYINDDRQFVPLTSMVARDQEGFQSFLTTGLYKDSDHLSEDPSGMFIGLGNEENPDEYFTLCSGGKIKHSSGSTFYSTYSPPDINVVTGIQDFGEF